MSQSTQKIQLETALWMAKELEFQLSPLCQKFEIAGSVRRKEPECGDIEIVCIPHFKAIPGKKDLFGQLKPEYRNRVIDWIDAPGNDETIRIKGGLKYQKVEYKGIPIDIFMTSQEEFGRMLAIRTGPANYSKKIAARWVEMGYKGVDGKLVKSSNYLDESAPIAGPFLTEESFFEFLGWTYIKPEARK